MATVPVDDTTEAARERACRFNYLDPELSIEDIFELFSDPRTHCPVSKTEAWDSGAYLVMRHKDVKAALHNPQAFINGRGAPPDMGMPLWLPSASNPPELHELRSIPNNSDDLIAERRAAHTYYQTVALPDRWTGDPQPVITSRERKPLQWDRLSGVGVGASGGVA